MEGEEEMSEFSDILEKHIMMCGLTENYLSNITGFSRSYISKLINGQRVSPNIEKMTLLFNMLNLTPEEYAVLWDLYLKERLGNEKYQLNKEVLDFVDSFHMSPNINFKMDISFQIPDVKVITGRIDVESFIKIVIYKEANKKSGYLRVAMQGESERVLEAIRDALMMNDNFRVSHLVCMEKMTDKNSYENIRLLKSLIPIILSGHEYNYHAYYYYDNIEAHFNRFSWMPYCVITEDYYVCVDAAFEHGVIYKDEDIRMFMIDLYESMIEECQRLCHPIYNNEQMIQYYSQINVITGNTYTIAYQPCMGILDIEDLFDKYATNEYKTTLEGLKARIRKRREIYEKNQWKLVTYFTREGIEEFMRTGFSRELPKGIYGEISYEDRKKVIRSMLRMARDDIYYPYLIDERKYKWPEEVMVESSDLMHLGLFYNINQKYNRFIIQEVSLACLFHKFMVNFRDSMYTKTREETISYLESLVE